MKHTDHKKKKKGQVVYSEEPVVDMDRDLAQYGAGRNRHRASPLTACMVVAVVFLAGFLAAGCLFGGFFKRPEPLPDSAQENDSQTESAWESDSCSESDSGNVPGEKEPEELEEPPASLTDSLYWFDPDQAPEGTTPIRPMNLAAMQLGNGYLSNTTGLDPALMTSASLSEWVLSRDVLRSGEPLVLILHTHTTESYRPEGETYCDTNGNYARSELAEENVTAVGEEFARTLRAYGIAAIHCTEVFDSPSVRGAYDRSAEVIQRYLKTYPSIRYVIDIHRDAVTDSAGNLVRAVTEVNGQAAAQVMCVVGTDENGTACPWTRNCLLAQNLRCALNEAFDDICRPTVLRSSSFNQEFAACSLLLEIGTVANSLSEAKYAAMLTAQTLALMIAEP